MWKAPGLTQLRLLPQWHVHSQQRARRNALLASTALADRRKERIEVEELLSALGGAPAAELRLPVQRRAVSSPPSQRIG